MHHGQLQAFAGHLGRKQQPEPVQAIPGAGAAQGVPPLGTRHHWSHMAQDSEGRHPTAHGMIQEEPTAPADGEAKTGNEGKRMNGLVSASTLPLTSQGCRQNPTEQKSIKIV